MLYYALQYAAGDCSPPNVMIELSATLHLREVTGLKLGPRILSRFVAISTVLAGHYFENTIRSRFS